MNDSKNGTADIDYYRSLLRGLPVDVTLAVECSSDVLVKFDSLTEKELYLWGPIPHRGTRILFGSKTFDYVPDVEVADFVAAVVQGHYSAGDKESEVMTVSGKWLSD